MPRVLMAFAIVHASRPKPPVGKRLKVGDHLCAGFELVRERTRRGVDCEDRHGTLVGKRAPVAACRVDLAVVDVEVLYLARKEAGP